MINLKIKLLTEYVETVMASDVFTNPDFCRFAHLLDQLDDDLNYENQRKCAQIMENIFSAYKDCSVYHAVLFSGFLRVYRKILQKCPATANLIIDSAFKYDLQNRMFNFTRDGFFKISARFCDNDTAYAVFTHGYKNMDYIIVRACYNKAIQGNFKKEAQKLAKSKKSLAYLIYSEESLQDPKIKKKFLNDIASTPSNIGKLSFKYCMTLEDLKLISPARRFKFIVKMTPHINNPWIIRNFNLKYIMKKYKTSNITIPQLTKDQLKELFFPVIFKGAESKNAIKYLKKYDYYSYVLAGGKDHYYTWIRKNGNS